MLAQVQNQIASRDLHVERRRFVKAVFPIDREAEEVKIELFRFVDRENPQDRNHAFKLDSHHSTLQNRARKQAG